MPHCPALVLAIVLVAAVRAIPVDEISARNGIGGQADGGSESPATSNCTGTPADCNMSALSGISLLKIASENAGNRGNALVELASLLTGLGGGGSGLSGAVGEAPGDSHPVLIKLDSDDVGQGGDASRGKGSRLVN